MLDPIYRRVMLFFFSFGAVALSVFLYYHFFVKKAESVFPTFYIAIAVTWIIAVFAFWVLLNATPEKLVRKLLPVNGRIVQLGAQVSGAIPYALIEFKCDDFSNTGVVRMNEMPRNVAVGGEIRLWVHPRMVRKKWPELICSPQLDAVALRNDSSHRTGTGGKGEG